MPTCLSCYKHFKLKASDDPQTEVCKHCIDNYEISDDDFSDISVDASLDTATRLDIEHMLNPSGRTPARFND